MFKVNNKDVYVYRRSDVYLVNINFKHISHLFLVFLLLTLNKSMFAGVSKKKYASNKSNLQLEFI